MNVMSKTAGTDVTGCPDIVCPYQVTVPACRISDLPVSRSTPPLYGKSWFRGGAGARKCS